MPIYYAANNAAMAKASQWQRMWNNTTLQLTWKWQRSWLLKITYHPSIYNEIRKLKSLKARRNGGGGENEEMLWKSSKRREKRKRKKASGEAAKSKALWRRCVWRKYGLSASKAAKTAWRGGWQIWAAKESGNAIENWRRNGWRK